MYLCLYVYLYLYLYLYFLTEESLSTFVRYAGLSSLVLACLSFVPRRFSEYVQYGQMEEMEDE